MTAARDVVSRDFVPTRVALIDLRGIFPDHQPLIMVFKPFRPPLIRKPSQPRSNSDATDQGPPPKKQRLSGNGNQPSAAQKERKPLLQLQDQNAAEENNVGDDDSSEKYYNVLWSVEALFSPRALLTRG